MKFNRRSLLAGSIAAIATGLMSPVCNGASILLLGTGGGPAGAFTDANVTAVNAEGWSVTYTSPPTFDPVANPKYVVASRAGYDNTASTTTYTDNLIITQRVRQAYPSQASLDASRCALSDYIYSTDTVSGVTNNSTVASPKPVANWSMPGRQTVGNTLNLEVCAFHRNARGGKQVACVKFIATDGSTTVTQIVTAAAVSNRTGDQNAVVTYSCALDISTLTNAHLITANAEVYPWIGNSSTILKSADSAVAREFSPRYFLKNTTKTASPPYAYVLSTGNDGTGIWSTTAATAKATPFLTLYGALFAINNGGAQGTAAGGVADGCIVRMGAPSGASWVLPNTFNLIAQNVGAVTITRDPVVSRAACILSFGAAGAQFRIWLNSGLTAPVASYAMIFDDVSILRSGTGAIQGETSTEVIFNNVAFDNGSVAGSWLSAASDWFYGCTFTNIGTTALQPATDEHRCFRGCTADLNGNNLEGHLLLANNWTRPGKPDELGSTNTPPDRSASGTVCFGNKFLKPDASTGLYDFGGTGDITGFAFVQNLVETCHTTTATFSNRASGDSPALGNLSHIIFHHNTYTGFMAVGRENLFYDVTTAHHRTHKLHSFVGNIHSEINTKGDVFFTDGTFIGNWGFLYGAGSKYEWSQWIDAASGGLGTSFAQAYPGLGSSLGTSATVRHDPVFTDYEGTTNSGSSAVAGTGGGTYTLQGGSPCRLMVIDAVLNFDLAGTARPSTLDSVGAYA